jgi:hypothetical protein
MPSEGLLMPTDKSKNQVAPEPSEESVERMLAFAGLLAALERRDPREALDARTRLRELGVTVRIAEVTR